jgi:hypothetical protein
VAKSAFIEQKTLTLHLEQRHSVIGQRVHTNRSKNGAETDVIRIVGLNADLCGFCFCVSARSGMLCATTRLITQSKNKPMQSHICTLVRFVGEEINWLRCDAELKQETFFKVSTISCQKI